MEVVKIENCYKAFDGKYALNDVSLSINRGEVVSIIGPSGSGKSTLLRILSNLEIMDKGAITYLGKNIQEYTDKKELSSIYSMVFQSFNLFPHFSVLKNIVDAPVNVLKMDKNAAISEANALLDKLGILDKKDAYPYQLSGGEKQRVAIARALIMKPEIIYFDEPTSALDPEHVNDILKIIKDLANQNMTMLIVTHEMNFAKNISDRIIFMANGTIIEEGSPDDLFNNPKEIRTKKFLSGYLNKL